MKTYLRWQNYEGDAYHYDHVELWRPNVWNIITVSNSWERNDNIVGALEKVHVTMTRSLMSN